MILVNKETKAKKHDIQIRKMRRFQERIKVSKEREVMRLHKVRRNQPLLSIDDLATQFNSCNISGPIQINSCHDSLNTIEKTPGRYNKRLNKDFKYEKLVLGSRINVKQKDKTTSKSHSNSRYQCENKAANSNDYGFILSSKYQDVTVDYPKHHSFKSNTETNSPLKRWKKHLNSDSQGRIQLISNVFNS